MCYCPGGAGFFRVLQAIGTQPAKSHGVSHPSNPTLLCSSSSADAHILYPLPSVLRTSLRGVGPWQAPCYSLSDEHVLLPTGQVTRLKVVSDAVGCNLPVLKKIKLLCHFLDFFSPHVAFFPVAPFEHQLLRSLLKRCSSEILPLPGVFDPKPFLLPWKALVPSKGPPGRRWAARARSLHLVIPLTP